MIIMKNNKFHFPKQDHLCYFKVLYQEGRKTIKYRHNLTLVSKAGRLDGTACRCLPGNTIRQYGEARRHHEDGDGFVT